MKIKEIAHIGENKDGRTIFNIVLEHKDSSLSFLIAYKEEDKYVTIAGVDVLAKHKAHFDHTLEQKILRTAIEFIEFQSPEDKSPYALVDEVKKQCDAFIVSQKKESTQ